MPQVDATQITSEESQKQLMAQESMQSNLLDKIKGGDVFKSLTDDMPAEETQELPEEEIEQPEVEQEEEQEDVVPKSKIQPRIDRLTSQIKQLEQRLAERETQAQPVDDTQRKLDNMSENELEDVLTNVRLQKEKSRDNDENLLQLVRLERQIEKTIQTAPQKFVQRQVVEYNKMADRLTSRVKFLIH